MPNDRVSPFPGMDPYLESPAVWGDFHARFINELANAMNDQLPPDYVAAIGEHVSPIGPGPADAEVVPDVAVVGPARPAAPDRPTGGARVAAAAVTVGPQPTTLRNRRPFDPDVQVYIEVLRLPEQQPVTVIEVLSPKNKRGDGRAIYIEKRNALLDTPVSLVELDLLRGGRRVELVEPLPAGDYYAYVSRGDRRPMWDVYAWAVRDPLPTVAVPLRPEDGELRVGLAAPFAEAYRRGRFRQRARYAAAAPPPAWAADDAAWVAAALAADTRSEPS